mmetsp:Transcript_29282/g.73542  ORF Transcript_29282/g.73542 Transcript_29282/m.73542 type:complete len:246 (+) Transcript_29282:1444-2181(+)
MMPRRLLVVWHLRRLLVVLRKRLDVRFKPRIRSLQISEGRQHLPLAGVESTRGVDAVVSTAAKLGKAQVCGRELCNLLHAHLAVTIFGGADDLHLLLHLLLNLLGIFPHEIIQRRALVTRCDAVLVLEMRVVRFWVEAECANVGVVASEHKQRQTENSHPGLPQFDHVRRDQRDCSVHPTVREQRGEGRDDERGEGANAPRLARRNGRDDDRSDHEEVERGTSHDCRRAKLARVEAVPDHLDNVE